MKLSCDIIRDLLPLYAEELASEDSQAAVREHLETCEDCRSTFADMKKSPVIIPEEPGLDTVRRELWKRRLLTALCAVLIVCMAGCWFVSYFTAPIYLDLSVIAGMEPDENGTVWLTFDAAKAGEYTFQFEVEPTLAGEVYAVWTSHWLRWKFNEPQTRKITIPATVMHNGIYYFTGVDGAENVLIYENPEKYIDGGFAFLPRLYLSFYFQMSLLVGAAALVLAFVLRRRRAGKWLALVGSFLCCYGLCQGIVCGFTFASFFAQQELFWALAMGLCLWGALICIWAMRKKA